MSTVPQHKHQLHEPSYYIKCLVGGILACGTTHTIICPLDLVKCRKQVNPNLYKSIGDGFKTVFKANGFGAKGLYRGWLPTLIGYSMQGMGKFGLYELFKDCFARMVGEEQAKKFRVVGWLACSAYAHMISSDITAVNLGLHMMPSKNGNSISMAPWHVLTLYIINLVSDIMHFSLSLLHISSISLFFSIINHIMYVHIIIL
jgi:hypothetical protein